MTINGRINLVRLCHVTWVLLAWFCLGLPHVMAFDATDAANLVTRQQIDQVLLFNHLQALSAERMQGRKIATPGNIMSQDYIISNLTAYGISAYNGQYRHTFNHQTTFSNVQGTNIVAHINGQNTPQQYLILSAHYDHLGSKGRKIFHGTDDNASGTAALLALARLFQQHPLSVSVILLFSDGEETNLLGSKHFIKQNPDLVKNTVLNVNLDMLSGDRSTRCLHFISRNLEQQLNLSQQVILALADEHSFCLKQGFRSAIRTSLITQRSVNWINAGDHGSFHRAGVPFIYFGVGVNKNYHTEQDQYQNANLPFFAQATEFIYNQLRYVDQHLKSAGFSDQLVKKL